MSESYVLTFDIGTQSARCMLVRPDGSFADMVQKKYDQPYFSKEPGWAEQTPDFYFDEIAALSKTLLERNAGSVGSIMAVTLTCIRDTVLCLDKDRKPLRDIILWLDQRKADSTGKIPPAKAALFRLVGMGEAVKILFRATAANWLMQNEPELWEQTDKYVMLPTYLNYKLTGELKDAASDMIGHVPFDYKGRCWMGTGELTRCVCDVPQEKLCELVPSGAVIGNITEDAAAATGIPVGLPLIATGSDKGCETLGLSVIRPEQAAVSFGTTATLQMAVKDYFEPQPFMPAYPGVPNDIYNPEFEVYRGFWMLSWFVEQFGAADREEAEKQGISAEQLLDDRIRDIPPCCDGLLLQPFWTAGITNPNARGAIVGFSDHHTRYHLYRAMIEGVCMELYHGLCTMQKRSGKTVKALFAGGGGASSDVVCQIAADVFGLPVKRSQTHEASAVGSSMVAFIALGTFRDYEDAIGHMVQMKDEFTPDAENHRIYMEYYNAVYSRLPAGLKNTDKNIVKLMKRRSAE
ncbi:MAG: FGGY-family carbohydrate kinase [Clostridia bacterium]|nr:FGGY-family carbohydrate kinase [Clostridia bacterium]